MCVCVQVRVCECVQLCACMCVYLLFDNCCCCTLQFLVPCSICASSSSISLGCVLSSFSFCSLCFFCFCFFSASADFQSRLGCLFFCLRFFCSAQLSVLITHDNDNDNLTSLCCLLGQLKFPFSSSLFIYLFIGDFQHFISLVCVECLLYAFCFLRF